MADRYYFRNDFVEVTRTRAIFGSKSYAINGITSTDLIEIPPKRMKPIMLLLTGLAFGFCARMPGLRQQNGGVFVMVGVMFAIPAVIWLFRQKTEYAVLICTAAHETEAYVTYNLKIAEDIVSAINKATSDRG